MRFFSFSRSTVQARLPTMATRASGGTAASG